MATKDITDLQVVQAYAERVRQRAAGEIVEHADTILARVTSEPLKVCYRAMERAERRGLVDYGMWLRGGWLTDKGMELLAPDARCPD